LLIATSLAGLFQHHLQFNRAKCNKKAAFVSEKRCFYVTANLPRRIPLSFLFERLGLQETLEKHLRAFQERGFT
jgi:hypothetical protein